MGMDDKAVRRIMGITQETIRSTKIPDYVEWEEIGEKA